MLFSDNSSDSVRDKLIKLIEAAVYCLNVLGQKDFSHDKQIECVYRELSEAMANVIDANTIKHSEYDYILYRAQLKLKLHYAAMPIS